MRSIAVAGACFALVATGCGSDGDSAGQGTSAEQTQEAASAAPTREEFIAAGDAICQDLRERQEEITDRAEGGSASEQADGLRAAAELIEEGADRFEALDRPSDGAAVIDRYIEISRENATLARRAAEAIGDGNVPQANAMIENATKSADEAKGIAQGFGFKICGSGS